MQKFKTITGKELLEKEIEQIPFVVNEILPIGLSLLAGESKIGKSRLSLWQAELICFSLRAKHMNSAMFKLQKVKRFGILIAVRDCFVSLF